MHGKRVLVLQPFWEKPSKVRKDSDNFFEDSAAMAQTWRRNQENSDVRFRSQALGLDVKRERPRDRSVDNIYPCSRVDNTLMSESTRFRSPNAVDALAFVNGKRASVRRERASQRSKNRDL